MPSGSSGSDPQRRLMRYAGRRAGRPVYVGTLCNAAGVRRLMEYVGEYPGFWTGSGSGDGEWVPPRPVYVSAECVTGADFPGSGSGGGGGGDIPGGGTTYVPGGDIACCPGYGSFADYPFPAAIRMRLDRYTPSDPYGLGPYAISLDGLEIPLYFRPSPGPGFLPSYRSEPVTLTLPYTVFNWPVFGPPTVVGSGFETVTISAGLVLDCLGENTIGWAAGVTVWPTAAGAVGFAGISNPAIPRRLGATSTCDNPFPPLVFGRGGTHGQVGLLQDSLNFADNWRSYKFTNIDGPSVLDEYVLTVTGPTPDPGSGGSGGGGSGGGGSGGSGGDSAPGTGRPWYERALMLRRGARGGRPVYVGTCCPFAGSGSGPFPVDCPTTPLEVTIDVTECGAGGTFPLVYTAGGWELQVDTSPGLDLSTGFGMRMTCLSDGTYAFQPNTPAGATGPWCGPTASTEGVAPLSTSPLHVQYVYVSSQSGLTITLDVTEV